jgi:predicted ATPase
VTTLSLGRLNRGESDELVRSIGGSHAALPKEVVDEIVERTDGVPLFLEELTKTVLEAVTAGADGSGVVSAVPATLLAVPATLHASLMARLDRLGAAAKELAQIGAAIGRDFSYELLAATAQRSDAELRDALDRLVDAGLVFQRGAPPQATFLFKHALVQDTAYSMLLRGQRQALHARIARTLEERFPSLADTQPQILAHHFTEARFLERAVRYWCSAGERSTAKSALVEAIAQLRRGLLLITDLPDSRERTQQELDLQVTLAGALMGARGYAHPEVAEAFGRATTLISNTESAGTILHFSVLYGRFSADYVGGKPKAALDRAREFLSLAQSQKDSGLLLMGYRLVSVALITIGDYPAALSHAERAVALYMPGEHGALAFRFGQDIGVSAFSYYSWALWHRGYPDQATNAACETLRYARQSVHVHTLAYALFHIGFKAATERRVAEVEERANELVGLAKEHGFAMWLGYGLMLHGWAMAQCGQGGAAVERIRDGLAATLATGARNLEPIFLGLQAEALALTGATDEGLAVLTEALAAAKSSSQEGNDAELHRLRGEIMRRLPSPNWTEVEVCFRTALTIARQQGTRGFELRAAVSLARLLRDQGRRDAAGDLLAPVYGWFTEGFDTPDLKEARALIDELDT